MRFVSPLAREKLVNELKPRSRETRLVRSEGGLKLVRSLPSRSRFVNPTSPAGKVRLWRPLFSSTSETKFVSPLGKERLVSKLTLRSRTVRFVSCGGREKLVRRLIWRSSETVLDALSSSYSINPARIVTRALHEQLGLELAPAVRAVDLLVVTVADRQAGQSEVRARK